MARLKTVAEKAADNPDTADRPAKLLTHETLVAKGERVNARTASAASKTFKPTVNDGWKEQEKLWPNATEDERKGMLYDMVVWCGYVMGTKNVMKRLANYFAIDVKELEPFKTLLWMADEARVAKIDQNIITGFLLSDKNNDGKYHLNNTYAYKVRNPAWEGVDSVNQAPTQIIYNEVKAGNEELRAELAELVRKRTAEVDRQKVH